MTIVRVGATQDYATGWANAFGKGGKKAVAGGAAKSSKSSAKKGKRKAKK